MGLVPRSWTLQDTKLGYWRQFGSGVLTEACTYIFGDGSGTHSDLRIKRVAWSAVIFQGVSNCLGQTPECWKLRSERLMNSLKRTGGWMGTLGEGDPNTVGRAELMACVVAAGGTRGNVVYVTDYEIFKKRQDRGWPTPRLGQGSNPDLWWRLSRALKSRQGTFTVQWQRAHVDADIKSENRDMAIVFGNEMADAMAEKAASEAALRRAAVEQVAWVDALIWQVQRRTLRQTCKRPKPIPLFDTSGERSQESSCRRFSNNQHTNWHFGDPGRGGNVTFVSRAWGETSLVRWLRAGPCSGEIQTIQSIGNSLGMAVQQVRAGAYCPIGWKIVHPSHSVALYRGVTWCCNCAAWTSRSLCKLSTQCSGVIKATARDALSRIKRGYPTASENELAVTSDGI